MEYMDGTLLKEQIITHKAKISVIGLGYVGLPLIREFCLAGFPVIGFDTDNRKVSSLLNGVSYIKHIPSEFVVEMIESARFDATSDYTRIKEADVIIICVQIGRASCRERV